MTEPSAPAPISTDPAAEAAADGAEIDDQFLIEEISIDGMCGVY